MTLTKTERFVSAAGVECAGCAETITDGVWSHSEHWCDGCAPGATPTYSAPVVTDGGPGVGRRWYVRETGRDGLTVRVALTGEDDQSYRGAGAAYDSKCGLCYLGAAHSRDYHAAAVAEYLAQAEAYRQQLRASNVGDELKRRLFELSDYGRHGLTY